MGYLKRGPWATGDVIDDTDLTAMDAAIAASQHTAHLDLGSVSGTILIDATTYGSVSLRLTGDATLSVSGLSPTGAVGHLDIFINTDGHTVTWPTGTVWPGAAPTLMGAPDYVRLIGQSGTIFGRLVVRYRYNESQLPAVGSAFMGGFYAGIMDTIATAPDSRDVSQRRLRFALIVSPRTMQSSVAGKNSWVAHTAWDGEYISDSYGVAGLPDPHDGASRWYLPSIFELALLYWQFKPSTTQNYVGSAVSLYTAGDYNWAPGTNVFAVPPRSAFTATSPARTTLTAFQSGGAQYIGITDQTNFPAVASISDIPGGGETYGINFLGSSPGQIKSVTSNISMTAVIRPVRRLILAEAA